MPLSSYSEVKGVKELSLPSVAKELRQQLCGLEIKHCPSKHLS